MGCGCTRDVSNVTNIQINPNSNVGTYKFLAEINIDIPVAINVEHIHKIKTYPKYKLNEKDKDEIFGEENGFREYYEKPEIDNEAMNTAVKEKSWDEHFTETIYYKYFMATNRYNVNLLEAINEICVLAPKNKDTFMKFYKELKSKPATVVTLMWSYEPCKPGEIKIYKLINMALIIDAKKIFGDEMKGNIDFATNFLDQYGSKDVEHVIKHSIKFIRILNTALVDEGRKHNTKDRITYRGVDSGVFKNCIKDEVYRVITWNSSSESESVAERFRKMSKNAGCMIKYHIPKDCYNAGKINFFGKSCFPGELETLIPPYTSIKMMNETKVKSIKHYEVKVTRDNKCLDFSTLVPKNPAALIKPNNENDAKKEILNKNENSKNEEIKVAVNNGNVAVKIDIQSKAKIGIKVNVNPNESINKIKNILQNSSNQDGINKIQKSKLENKSKNEMKYEINKEQNKQNMPVNKKNLNANQELEILQDLIKDEKSDMNKDKIIKQDPIKNNEVNIENDLKTKQKPDLLPKLRNLPSLKIKVPNHVNPNDQNKIDDDLKKENILNKDQSINLNKDMNPKIPSPEKTTISIKNNLNDLESLLDDSTEEEKLINIGSNSKNNSIIRPIKKKKKKANFLNIKEALSQSSNYLSDDQDSNGIKFLNDEESMNDNSLDSDKFNKKDISVNKNLKIAEPSIVDIFKPKDRNFKGIINIDSLHSDELDIKSEMSNEDSDNQHSLKSADMKRLELNDKYDEDEKQEKSTNLANQSKAYYQSNADISSIKDPKLDFSKYSTNPNNIYDPDYVVHLSKYLNLRNDYNQDYEFYPNNKLNLENDCDYNDNVILLNKNKKNNMQKKIKVPDHIKIRAELRANNQNFVPSPARTQTPENLDNSRLPISNRVLVSAGYSAIKGLANDKDIFKNE